MSFLSKIKKNYQITASATYDLSDFNDDFVVDAELSDYTPGSSGGWHEPAYGDEIEILVNGFTFDTKAIEDEDIDLFKKIKVGDKLTVYLSDSVDIPLGPPPKNARGWDPEYEEYDKYPFTLKALTVTGVKWQGSVIEISCHEIIKDHGPAPLQSHRGRD